VAACRQEPPPLRENPEFLQSQERNQSRARLYESAKNMTPGQVAAAEAAWKANPDDLATLERILIYYGHDYSGKDTRDVARVVKARRPYILWLIEHHPGHEMAGTWAARIFPWSGEPLPDREGYEAAKKLWLAQAARPDVTAAVLGNAAWFFETNDKQLAEQMLVKAIALEPNGRWSRRLGRLYALMLAGANSSMPLGVIRSMDQNAAAAAADGIQQKLRASNDAQLLESAGEDLIRYRRSNPKVAFAVDLHALGTSCLERAIRRRRGSWLRTGITNSRSRCSIGCAVFRPTSFPRRLRK
jgi:hypothetical protein